ncbi:MAG TPA: beta-propeller fold lactonase family protein, partial [Chloroflexota bacterium]|nr:beta-propeller fold lactonase family protein [Chloroflexota bacterium]
GTGDTADRLTPAAVSSLSGVVAIAAGGHHSLALQSDGRIKAWGQNVRGQLGDGTTFDRSTPVSVIEIAPANAIAAGFAHSLAIVVPAGAEGAAGGAVHAWGDNSSGQVGNGSIDPFHVRPRAVSGVTNAVAIAAGGSHSLAVRSARAGGTVAAWGNNTRGQLGIGTTDDSLVPKDATNSANTLAAAAGYFHSLSLRVVPASGTSGTPTPVPSPTSGTGTLPQVIATVAVAGDPADVAINATTNRVYVSHIGVESLTSTDQVSIIDGATNTATTVGLTVSTSGLAVNPSASRLYLANFFEPSFTVLSTEGGTLAALSTIPSPNGPVAVAFNASTGLVYLSSFSEHQLVVIDVSGATPAIVRVIPMPNNPVGVAINPTTNRIYVASLSGDSVTVVDGQTHTVIATVATGDGAVGVAVNPTTNRVFVANGNASTVSVIDGATNQVIATVPVGPNPTGIAVNANFNHIFVTNRDADTVEVLDGASPSFGVYARLSVGAKPFNLAVNPTTNRVYVANNAGASVTVIQDYATSGTSAIELTPVAVTSSAPVVVPPRPTLIPRATPTPRSIAADILAWLAGGTPTPQAAAQPTPQAPIGPPPFTRPVRFKPAARAYTAAEVEAAALAQIGPGAGAQVHVVWPPAAATPSRIVVTHEDERSALSLSAETVNEEPLLIRLQPGAPAALPSLPALPATTTVFQVDVLNVDGTRVTRHAQPLQICARVSDAQLAEGGGDLTRFALLRWNERAGYYERLPQAVVYLVEQRVCASTVETSTFVVAVLPKDVLGRPVADPRYFPETGFRIADDDFWSYFQHRGGIVAFGYPVSRPFQLFGTEVQFFQRRVLQRLPDGTVQQLNILDDTLFPFRRINGSTFPAPDPKLLAEAPSPDATDYATRALAFVREHAVLDFGRTYFSTVTCADAYPDQPCSEEIAALLNLEMWGLPLSEPVLDPAYRAFAYQLFQRGVMHYDFETDTTHGILLGDWWKSLITGEGLPSDLETDAIYTPFWRQFTPQDTHTGMWWPEELAHTSMAAAFVPDLPREPILTAALFAAEALHTTPTTEAG